MQTTRYEDSEGTFTFALPNGWEAIRDEEGGLLVSAADGFGLLHLIAFGRDPAEEIDPAEELYAFLANQEIEVEEEEIEDLELAAGGLLALCEYGTEEDDEAVYWLVAVAAAPGQLVFANYSCPMEEEENGERELILGLLRSLAFEVEESPAT